MGSPFALNYREDRRSVVVGVITFAMNIAALFVPLSWTLALIWIPVATQLAFVCCVLAHNHVHLRTFANPAVDFVYDTILAIARGHTSDVISITHNEVHHAEAGGENDWVGNHLAGSGSGFVRMIRYTFRATARVKIALRKERKIRPRTRTEKWTFGILYSFMFAAVVFRPENYLLLVFLPSVGGMIITLTINLLQHDGCEIGHPYRGSRNFTGDILNVIVFNNGFHTVHHLYPKMHWSKTKAFHYENIAAKTDPRFDRVSLARYFFVDFLFGRRA